MAFGRDSWLQIQDNRMIIMYMFVSACAFSYIYYITAKSPINLEESKVGQQKQEYEEEFSMPMNHLKNTNYNTQDFANTRQQHYDARDMVSGLPPVSGFL